MDATLESAFNAVRAYGRKENLTDVELVELLRTFLGVKAARAARGPLPTTDGYSR
jgi:hypothetical protein